MKTLTIENLELHGPDSHGSSFHIKRFYEKVYKEESSNFTFVEPFDLSLIEYCFKNFTLIYHTHYQMFIEGLKNKINEKNFLDYISVKRKPTLYFKYRDYIITLNITDKNSKESDGDDDYVPEILSIRRSSKNKKNSTKYINKNNSKIFLNVAFPSSQIFNPFDGDFSFLEEYKINDKDRNFVSVLIKNQYGEYDFEPLDIKVPKTDLELNYGKNFSDDVYKKIVHKLKNNNKGLYMFHGEPGTGKSSFIKHLTTVVKKEFIFVPTSFIERFISDPDIFAILLRRKNCVLILEDAEKILISRDKEDNQFISTLLNISDGILSDILEASVVLTYNCDEAKIDKALKRKGRTMIDYKFNKLSLDDAKRLAEHLKIDADKIKEPMTLSEIYNMEDENKFYEEKEDDKKRIIGFNPN